MREDDAGLGLAVDLYLRRLAVPVVAVDAGQVIDLLVGDLVTLVVEALLHLPEEARAVDELYPAAPLRRLAVRHEPDIGKDAGVVEKLVGQRHDGVEPVVLDDPAADVGRPRTGVAGKEWRAVENDGDLGTGPVFVPLLVGMHLGNHVLKE